MDFNNAQRTIDAVITHSSVVLLADIFRRIIVPALRNASSDLGSGFHVIDMVKIHDELSSVEPPLFDNKELQRRGFEIFAYLTNTPLARDSKKCRSLNVSDPACVADTLVQIRRMLLVRSETNENNIFESIIAESNHRVEWISTDREYRSLDLDTQYSIAAKFYFELIRNMFDKNPKVVQVQLESDLSSQFRLIFWGDFKMKK
jgi:hypothetical protein